MVPAVAAFLSGNVTFAAVVSIVSIPNMLPSCIRSHSRNCLRFALTRFVSSVCLPCLILRKAAALARILGPASSADSLHRLCRHRVLTSVETRPQEGQTNKCKAQGGSPTRRQAYTGVFGVSCASQIAGRVAAAGEVWRAVTHFPCMARNSERGRRVQSFLFF